MSNDIHENKIQCKHCMDFIMSIYHDEVNKCGCGRIGISGGKKKKVRLKFENLLATETTEITHSAIEDIDYVELTTYLLNESK